MRQHLPTMPLVFDGPAQPLAVEPFSLLLLLPVVFWVVQRYGRRRPVTFLIPLIGLVLLAGVNGIRLWDQMRVRALAQSSGQVRMTRGVITDSWRIVSRSRDWSKSSLSYKRTVSEGFDVGAERFTWNVGDGYSPATFSNAGAAALTFPRGAPVEVTWFVDEASDNARRIIRLRLGKSSAPADAAFATFHRDFIAAFAAGDTGRLNALTRFPLRFGAHGVDRDRAETLWAGLLSPGLRGCVSAGMPTGEGLARMQLTCGRTNLVFMRDAGGEWRFSEVLDLP